MVRRMDPPKPAQPAVSFPESEARRRARLQPRIKAAGLQDTQEVNVIPVEGSIIDGVHESAPRGGDARMRVLLAEDDRTLGSTVAQGLREHAHAVDLVRDGTAAIDQLAVNEYDVVVLDILMPNQNGFQVCRALRARGSRVPVLLLTACDTEADRIAGFEAGADDYLTKPFGFAELLARLRALLRPGHRILPSIMTVGDLRIDTENHCVGRAGRAIQLTSKEYALLELLARNAGRIVSHSDICAHLWHDSHDPFFEAIEAYMRRLRQKVEGADETPLIHTCRTAGYMLAVLPEPADDATNTPMTTTPEPDAGAPARPRRPPD
jgi:DNA-binding response OmpR family regulator